MIGNWGLFGPCYQCHISAFGSIMNRSNHGRANAVVFRKREGFSLLELIVVVTIIVVLVALAVPAIGRARATAKRLQCSNNLRNIALALTEFEQAQNRLPASGYYSDPPGGGGGPHQSWAVSVLPWLDQENLYRQWDLEQPITSPTNQPLTRSYVPAFVCPLDLSRSKEKTGDLSYAVNGGWGFTVRTGSGIGDCPVDRFGTRLDLDGDGVTCSGTPSDDEDRKRFKQLGVFFLENWNRGGTVRHHSLADVMDGTTQTFLVAENVRAGFDPGNDQSGFADPNPYRCAFYIGNPCRNGRCASGEVDYSLSNQGQSRINSGLWSAEGSSPVPNSFHEGGVYMAYADGHVAFLSEMIDGGVYAALSSPQGMLLDSTPLKQSVVSGGE